MTDIEIILIDDGSPDKCPQIVDEYAAKDERIVVIHKPNGGYGSACNIGFERAKGEYIAIVEPDDFIDENMYRVLYKAAKKNDSDVVKSAFNTYYDITERKPHAVKNHWFPETKRKKNQLWEMPQEVFTIYEHPEFFYFHPSVWTCIYRRDFIERHRIRMEEIPGAGWADNLFQIQTLCLAKSIVYVDTAFYYWRLKHVDDAKDLKDLTIPFLRTRTIHVWLRANHITDENIWACLHKRELTYIQVVFRSAKFMHMQDLGAVRPMLEEMLDKMSPELIKTNRNITREELGYYHQFVSSSSRSYFFYRIFGEYFFMTLALKILKAIFSFKIRFGKKSFYVEKFRIIILGIQLALDEKDITYDIPCWKRVILSGQVKY